MMSGVGPRDQLAGLGIDLVEELPGVGQNLRDHPAAFILFRGHGDSPDDSAPSIQVGLRFSNPGSPTRADFQLSPILMNSEHRPASVQIVSDDFHFGLSCALQNAVSAGELRLVSTDPHVQPNFNYDYLSDPNDRERMREALRLALKLAEQPPFSDMIAERLNPTDADLVSDESLDNWMLRNAYTQHHISGTARWGRPRTVWLL